MKTKGNLRKKRDRQIEARANTGLESPGAISPDVEIVTDFPSASGSRAFNDEGKWVAKLLVPSKEEFPREIDVD